MSDYLTPFGIDVHLIQMSDKDPSIIGFENINSIIKHSKPLAFSDIISLKMNS